MKLFKNNIDRLESAQQRLIARRDKRRSDVSYANTLLRNKISKLQDKITANDKTFADYSNNITIKMRKNAKMIAAELNYAREINAKYTTAPVKKSHR